jgi:hypothetical protein
MGILLEPFQIFTKLRGNIRNYVFIAGVSDTGEKLFILVNDFGNKLYTVVNDTGDL